ncbi:MAG: hypothetical protein U0Z53_30430 [Blastocatellia bacterium]
MANGNIAPMGTIEGQKTNLSRTMHGIAFDAMHDEIIVPVALAGAVLVFRGDARGETAPIRVIQGPKTQMIRPHTVTVDPVNNEIIVGDRSGRSLIVYPRTANGDVPPLRVIQGDRTGLLDLVGVAVDYKRNVLIASNTDRVTNRTGLFFYNRTDSGNVAPIRFIGGPKSGIVRTWQIEANSDLGRVYVAAINNDYLAPYRLEKARDGLDPNIDIPGPWNTDKHVGFIGVWDTTDDGDVPPRTLIKGYSTLIAHPGGVTINVKDSEIYVTDSVRNGLLAFLIPEAFKPNYGQSAGH